MSRKKRQTFGWALPLSLRLEVIVFHVSCTSLWFGLSVSRLGVKAERLGLRFTVAIITLGFEFFDSRPGHDNMLDQRLHCCIHRETRWHSGIIIHVFLG